MCKVIAVANMKGGVGKTTTAVNLGIGLAMQGKRVLLLDCDSQGSLTSSLGFRKPSVLETSIATIMAAVIAEEEVPDGILHHPEGVDLVPSNEGLKGIELALVNVMSRELVLKEYVSQMKNDY
ncbi:MAG: AAA family ATPase, partial [Eubacteriaceae bacterium]|nr:AAA family ATPase [Eubacteriaceae bacterium]